MHDWHPRCPPPAGLVRPVPVDPAGLVGPTRGQAAGPRWRRTSRGLHVPADVPATAEQRILEAAARLPDSGMVTGWAALRMAGASYFDGTGPRQGALRPVPVLLPHSVRLRSAGLLVERTRRCLPPSVGRYGVPCAPAAVALLHELHRAVSDRSAGVMVDMALAAGVVDLRTTAALADGRHPLRPAASYALARACPDCRSPKESELMQVWEVDAGFPRPLMNREVLDARGRVVAVVDLLEAESGTYGEYNGASHRSRERQRRDEARAADLRALGLEGFVVVAGDSHRVWLERMRAARDRAGWLPEDRRAWRVGRTVRTPALPDSAALPDEAALDAIMLEHYRALE